MTLGLSVSVMIGSLYAANEVILNHINDEEKSKNGVTFIFNEESDKLDDSDLIFAHYSHLDHFESLTVLKSNADLIVSGKVSDHSNASELSVRSEVDVLSTKKGISHDEIKVYQMGQLGENEDFYDNLLEVGEEYILFLKKQGNAEENAYYIMGAEKQGKFKIQNGNLVNTDPIMSQQLKEKFELSHHNIQNAERVHDNKMIENFEAWLSE